MGNVMKQIIIVGFFVMCVMVFRLEYVEAETITESNGAYTITYDQAVNGSEYVLAVVKGTSNSYTISDDKFLYIDQKTADGNEVSFTFPFDENSEYISDEQYTILLSSNDKNPDNKYALVLGINIDNSDFDATRDSAEDSVYTGSAIEPSVSLTAGDISLQQGRDYVVTYSNNKLPGEGTITLLGTGKYKGSKNLNFNIIPEAPTTVACKLYAYNAMQVSWTKSEGASGYYVYYKKSSSNDYTYLWKTTSTSTKKSGLSTGTKYYFMVCPYVTIGSTNFPAYDTSTTNQKTSSNYTLKKMSTPRVSRAAKKYVKVSWSRISGASGYQIYRSKYKTKKYSRIKTINSKYSSVKIKTTRKKTYYYRIRAYNYGAGTVYTPLSSYKKYRLK